MCIYNLLSASWKCLWYAIFEHGAWTDERRRGGWFGRSQQLAEARSVDAHAPPSIPWIADLRPATVHRRMIEHKYTCIYIYINVNVHKINEKRRSSNQFDRLCHYFTYAFHAVVLATSAFPSFRLRFSFNFFSSEISVSTRRPVCNNR